MRPIFWFMRGAVPLFGTSEEKVPKKRDEITASATRTSMARPGLLRYMGDVPEEA